MNKNRVVGLVGMLLFSSLFCTSELYAQKATAWKKVCGEQANPATCRIRHDLFLQRKNTEGKLETVGRILRLNVLYSNVDRGNRRMPYLSIQVPMGVDLRPGTVFRIDNAKEIQLPFLRCTSFGCDASIQLSGKILQNMKAGKEIKVGFKKWGDDNVTVITATLTGFTAALSGIK